MELDAIHLDQILSAQTVAMGHQNFSPMSAGVVYAEPYQTKQKFFTAT
jgi:hypothetical protein